VYSLLPAIVAAVFLGYGLYVLAEKGFTRISRSFFLLCVITFLWQACWALLFQLDDPTWSGRVARFGYLLILFLPTSLYLFMVEICERPQERRWVMASYALSTLLAVLNLTTDLIVAGHHDYFFGPYPRAGPLHWVHMVQTLVVIGRSLVIPWSLHATASADRRMRLRLCVVSLLMYCFAAVDYGCNYGLEFYPPGVVFIAISLGLIMLAVIRYQLLSPMAVAATVAHEMRTPLASIRMQADALARMLPEMQRGYDLAVAHGLMLREAAVLDPQCVQALSHSITQQVDRSNVVIDLMLASSHMESIDPAGFHRYSIAYCVREALDSYPFGSHDRLRVQCQIEQDFEFWGSDLLMVYVLFNLLKNALYALQAAGKGEITITVGAGGRRTLVFMDTGSGIPAAVLSRIFEPFFTTKQGHGTGIGLAFCRRVIDSFGGRLQCRSVVGEHTTFTVVFPPLSA
jgi:two-component system CAI-1 autoinducer sensor kinase/phosphatase CqsS